MKKTLIALMALAGVAMAIGTNEFVVPTAGNFHAGDYILTFTIDEDDVIYNTDGVITGLTGGNVLALYAGSYDGDQYFTNGIKLNVADGAITLSAGRGSLSGMPDATSSISANTNITFGSLDEDYDTFSYALEVGTTYTLVNNVVITPAPTKEDPNATKGMQNISLYVAGSDTVLDTLTYNGNMSGGNLTTVIGTWGNSAYNVIPEPATATLSLLALAGLAARRRRK